MKDHDKQSNLLWRIARQLSNDLGNRQNLPDKRVQFMQMRDNVQIIKNSSKRNWPSETMLFQSMNDDNDIVYSFLPYDKISIVN